MLNENSAAEIEIALNLWKLLNFVTSLLRSDEG
jgi:hypothetical protein